MGARCWGLVMKKGEDFGVGGDLGGSGSDGGGGGGGGGAVVGWWCSRCHHSRMHLLQT